MELFSQYINLELSKSKKNKKKHIHNIHKFTWVFHDYCEPDN